MKNGFAALAVCFLFASTNVVAAPIKTCTGTSCSTSFVVQTAPAAPAATATPAAPARVSCGPVTQARKGFFSRIREALRRR